jgi:hypothetical protein
MKDLKNPRKKAALSGRQKMGSFNQEIDLERKIRMSDDSITTDAASSQREPQDEQPSGFLTGLQTLKSILNGLSGLIKLTEEEQKDAGIYLGDQH